MPLQRHKQGKVLAAKLLDRVARTFFWIGGRFTAPRTRTGRRDRILVVLGGALGDVVMAQPALTALRKRYPSARITLVSGPWAREILVEERVVDEIIGTRGPWLPGSGAGDTVRYGALAVRLRRERFDLGFDVRGDPRTLLFLYLSGAAERVSYAWYGARLGDYLLTDVVPGPALEAHLVERYLAVVDHGGSPSGSRVPQLHLSPSEQHAAQSWRRATLAQAGAEVIVGIHPGAANPLRLWRPERFVALAQRLAADPRVAVVIFAGPAERASAADIAARAGPSVVVEELGLRPFIVRVSALDALVALDSAPAHIGTALSVPVIALYGPALPGFTGPVGPTVRALQEGVFECRPCTQRRCVHPDSSCMDAISVERVLAATLEALVTRV